MAKKDLLLILGNQDDQDKNNGQQSEAEKAVAQTNAAYRKTYAPQKTDSAAVAQTNDIFRQTYSGKEKQPSTQPKPTPAMTDLQQTLASGLPWTNQNADGTLKSYAMRPDYVAQPVQQRSFGMPKMGESTAAQDQQILQSMTMEDADKTLEAARENWQNAKKESSKAKSSAGWSALAATLLGPAVKGGKPDEQFGAYQKQEAEQKNKDADAAEADAEKAERDYQRAWAVWWAVKERTVQEAQDFAEKSKYKSSRNGSKKYAPVVDPVTGNSMGVTMTSTGYQDALYDAINGDEYAKDVVAEQNILNNMHAGRYGSFYNLPEDLKKIYNYICATEGYGAGRDYLEALGKRVLDKDGNPVYGLKYSQLESFTWGFANGTGVMALMQAGASIGEQTGTNPGRVSASDWILTQNAGAAKESSLLFTAGNVAGDFATSILLMKGISKGINAIKGFSGLPGIAKSMINGATTMGGASAVKNFPNLLAGNIDLEDYLLQTGASAVGGAAGGAASYGISRATYGFLEKNKLVNNSFARKMAAGVNAAAFSGGKGIASDVVMMMGYGKDYKPSAERIVKDMLIAFAFAAVQSYADIGAEVEEKAKRPESDYFKGCENEEDLKAVYKNLAKQHHPDLFAGADAETQAAQAEIMKQVNAEYDAMLRWFMYYHLDAAVNAYKQAAQSSAEGDRAATNDAMTVYNKEIAALSSFADEGIITGESAAEAMEVLSSIDAQSMMDDAAPLSEDEGLHLPSIPEIPTAEQTPTPYIAPAAAQERVQQSIMPAKQQGQEAPGQWITAPEAAQATATRRAGQAAPAVQTAQTTPLTQQPQTAAPEGLSLPSVGTQQSTAPAARTPLTAQERVIESRLSEPAQTAIAAVRGGNDVATALQSYTNNEILSVYPELKKAARNGGSPQLYAVADEVLQTLTNRVNGVTTAPAQTGEAPAVVDNAAPSVYDEGNTADADQMTLPITAEVKGDISNVEGKEPAVRALGEATESASLLRDTRGQQGRDLSVAGAAGEATVRADARQTGRSAGHRAAVNARRQACTDVEPVSAETLTADGSVDQKLRVQPEDTWDAEQTAAAELAEKHGCKVRYVTGGTIDIVNGAGEVVMQADAMIERGTITVRADSPTKSVSESIEHELAHERLNSLRGSTRESTVRGFIDTLKGSFKEAAWKQIEDAYLRKYEGVNEDLAGDPAKMELAVWEEILCSAYAGINEYGVRASVYQAQAVDALDGAAAQQTDGLKLPEVEKTEKPAAARKQSAADTEGLSLPKVEKSPPGDKKTATKGGTVKYNISDTFEAEIQTWFDEVDKEDRSMQGGWFTVGQTSDPLSEIGVRNTNVYWRKSKIADIMDKHPEMDEETIKGVPQILETPIVIAKSLTQNDSIVLFGNLKAKDGNNVMAALNLAPIPTGGLEAEFTLLASAYGRSKGNIQSLLKNSEILYIDKDKNRAEAWLMSLGLQLPSGQPSLGSIGRVSYSSGKVNISGKKILFEKVAENNNAPKKKYSAADTDGEYLSLAEKYRDGTATEEETELLRQAVEAAAKKAGYDSPTLYHGTSSFGFKEFELLRMDDRTSIFLTDSERIASTYSGVNGVRGVSEEAKIPDNLDPVIVASELNANLPDYERSEGYKYISFSEQSKKNLIEKIKTNLETVRMYLYTSPKVNSLSESDMRTFKKLNEELSKEYDPENNNISTPLYLLARSGFFAGWRDVKVLDLESNIRLAKQMQKFDGKDDVIAKVGMDGYDVEVYSANEARDLLRKSYGKGNYSLYIKPGNSVEVDCKGRYWSKLHYKADVSRFYTVIDGAHGYRIYNAFTGQTLYVADTESGEFESFGEAFDKLKELLKEKREMYAFTYLDKTREISKWATLCGYDSVIFRNIADHGGANMSVPTDELSDIYISFSPNNVKSADLVTYDDNGEIIPLSKRFNSKNTDIRYNSADREALESVDGVRVGRDAETFTTDNQKVKFSYAVVPAEALTTSHDAEGAVNGSYPQELQPRDRGRGFSQIQITKISNNLQPQRLGESADASNGAPIVREDGVVVGGNKRTIALTMAYEKGRADGYREWLQKKAESFGITGDLPEHPVLVRIGRNVENWQALARKLNESTTELYSNAENAVNDAKNLDGNLLMMIEANDKGDLSTAANGPFMTAFVQTLPEAERAQMMSSNGGFTQQAFDRATAAVFAYVYKDTDLIEKMVEDPDNDIKSVTKGLTIAAAKAAQLQSYIEQGLVQDVGAVNVVLEGLNEFLDARSKGLRVSEADQTVKINEVSDEAKIIANFLDRNKIAGRISRFLDLLFDECMTYDTPDDSQLMLLAQEDVYREHTVREAVMAAVDAYNATKADKAPAIQTPEEWRAEIAEEERQMNEAAKERAEREMRQAEAEADRLRMESELRQLQEERDEAARQRDELAKKNKKLAEEAKKKPEAPAAPKVTKKSAEPFDYNPLGIGKPPKKGIVKEIRKRHPKVKGLGIPAGYADMAEYLAAVQSRAEETERNLLIETPREEFEGTPALQRMGIRIDHSVGVYDNIEGRMANYQAALDVQKAAHTAEKRLHATLAEMDFAEGVALGLYQEADIPQELDKDVVMELADYYYADKAVKSDTLTGIKRQIRDALDKQANELFRDADAFKTPPSILMNEMTPERMFRKIFGDKVGEIVNRWLVYPSQRNEAEKIRWINRIKDSVSEFTDSKGKKSAPTKDEWAACQIMIEGRAASEIAAGMEMSKNIMDAADNIANGMDPEDAAKEMGLSSELEKQYAVLIGRQRQVEQALADGQIDEVKVKEMTDKVSSMFNDLYEVANDVLFAHGMPTIRYKAGYAPHMQSEATQNSLKKALQFLGVGDSVSALPTDIAGLTGGYKPGKRWNPYFLERMTDKTNFDLGSAIDSYVEYMGDIVYHVDDIARLRAAARYFRKTFSQKEISERISWAENLKFLTTQEQIGALKQAGYLGRNDTIGADSARSMIEELIDTEYSNIEKLRKFGDLVTWLDNQGNIFAGKQSIADRSSEYNLSRKVLNLGRKITSAFGKANVAGNLSSMLNQTAQLPFIVAELGQKNVISALWDIINGELRRNDWYLQSDFLTHKHGLEYLVTTGWDKVITGMFKPAELMDTLMSTLAVRGAYLKNIAAGMEEADAIRAADRFGVEVMGSRAKGSRPQAYEAKNPISSMIHIFQVEAVNTWEHLLKDLPREYREMTEQQGKHKAAKHLAGVIVKMLLMAFALNRVAEEVYGGTPATFDVLGLTANFFASGEKMTTNEWIVNLLDNGLEKIFGKRVLGTDGMNRAEKFDYWTAAEDFVYNVSNDIPLLRNISGVLGLGDNTLPLPDVSGTFEDIKNAAKNKGVFSWEMLQALGNGLLQWIPGGKQISKTIGGATVLFNGGEYSGDKLKYPVANDVWTAIKLLAFGKYSTKESDRYFASGEKMLSEKQTAVYQSIEKKVGREEAYQFMLDARAASNDETLSTYEKACRLRELIDGLNLTDEEKAAVWAGLTSNDSWAEKFTTWLGEKCSWDDCMDVYEAAKLDGNTSRTVRDVIDGLHLSDEQKLTIYAGVNSTATSRCAKFSDMIDAGLTFHDCMDVWNHYSDIDKTEGLTSQQKQTELEYWVDKNYNAEDAAVINDLFKFFTSMPASAKQYETMTAAGLSPETAKKLAEGLNGLDDPSDVEKWRYVIDNTSDVDCMNALKVVMDENTYAKVEIAGSYGVSPDKYVSVKELMPSYDADGNGSYKQIEIQAAIEAYFDMLGTPMLTLGGGSAYTTEKAVLWQLLTGSTSAKNNPYSRNVGQEVLDKKNAAKEAQEVTTAETTQTSEGSGFSWISLPKP